VNCTKTAKQNQKTIPFTTSARLLLLLHYSLSDCRQPSFSGCCPRIWNSLLEHVVTAATLQSFKKHLKTFIPQRSYSLAL